MKPAVLVGIVQTIVLAVIAYQWIGLEKQKIGSNNLPIVVEKSQKIHRSSSLNTSALPSTHFSSVTSDEIRAIVRDELKSFYVSLEPSEQSVFSNQLLRTKQGTVNNDIVVSGDQSMFEQLSFKLEEYEFSGTMSQGDMEGIFSRLSHLNKQQRKSIRNRLTKAVNSGKINLL
jgi:hypothetical protein